MPPIAKRPLLDRVSAPQRPAIIEADWARVLADLQDVRQELWALSTRINALVYAIAQARPDKGVGIAEDLIPF